MLTRSRGNVVNNFAATNNIALFNNNSKNNQRNPFIVDTGVSFKKETCDCLKNTSAPFFNKSYQFSTDELIDLFQFPIGTKNIHLLKHSIALSLYAEEFAKELKLKSNEIDDIRLAAYLHDKGKLVISEKSFKDIESPEGDFYSKYKYHPTIAKIYLNRLEDLKKRDIPKMVARHHEKYSGNGFPKGMNNEELSLKEMIIPIIDAFDSKTALKYPELEGKRPEYIELSAEDAFKYLDSDVGKKFNPELYKKFKDMISRDDYAIYKKLQSQIYKHLEDFKLDYLQDDKISAPTKIRNLINPLTSTESYKKILAKELNCKVEDLKMVLSPEEVYQHLTNLRPENFNPLNAETGVFSINLHLHTTASDGEFTPETLMNELEKQVAKIRQNGKTNDFIVAITDHDTLEGSKNFLKYITEEIKKTPNRFDGIKFVPGIEINAFYTNPKYFHNPVQLEILTYCVNPFDTDLNNALGKIKSGNTRIIYEIIEDAKTKYNVDTTDFENFKSHSFNLKMFGGPGISYELKEYLKKKNLNDQQINDLFKDKIPVDGATNVTPNMETVLELTKGSIASIAHPTRIKLSKSLKEDMAISSTLDDGEIGLLRLFKDFASLGGYAAEANYYHDQMFIKNSDSFERLLKFIPTFCDQLDIKKGGGVDNHGLSLLKRYP